jgi:6-phosphogluconolactonase
MSLNAAEATIWVGTYSKRGSEGIYAVKMDRETGVLGAPAVAAKAENPSFLAKHPNGKFLYAVSETGRFEGKPVGAVRAFSIDSATGALTDLNSQPTGGAAPCHLAVDPSGKVLVVANYMDGNVAIFPIGADGKLAPMAQLIKHEGSGPNKKRQEKPHAHGVTFDATGKVAFVPDLGTDRVVAYAVDAAAGTLMPSDSASARTAPGAGPRHFAFHPNGKFAWSVNELDSTVTTYAWDAEEAALKSLRSISTLPEGFTNDNTTAEIVVHPSGRFLYASNRGHDSLAVFEIKAATGDLTPVEHQPCGGRAPRNFTLDPSGRFLLCANQDSDNIVVFNVDPETGRLEPAGHEVRVPVPVCVVFR